MKIALVAVVLVAAGCGGAAAPTPEQPRLPRSLAATWRTQSDAVAAALAAHDGCLARQRMAALRTGVIAAVNHRRVAPAFQETLLSAINDLSARIQCVPPPAAAPPSDDEDHGRGHGHGHGHGHGKGHDEDENG